MNVDDLLMPGDPGDLCDMLMDLLDGLEQRVEQSGIDSLPASVRTAYWVLVTDSAMNNEGIAELPEGGASNVGAALRELGLDALLTIYERALAAPNDTRLLDAWSSHGAQIETALVTWVRTHEAEFVAVP